jgi:hypothetical protein
VKEPKVVVSREALMELTVVASEAKGYLCIGTGYERKLSDRLTAAINRVMSEKELKRD